jgi:hypothetical protein
MVYGGAVCCVSQVAVERSIPCLNEYFNTLKSREQNYNAQHSVKKMEASAHTRIEFTKH